MGYTILLMALFFCHFLADFTHLSTSWMLDAKRFGKNLFPIYAHASVHSALMAIVLIPTHISLYAFGFLVLFQLNTHFIIDVLKGRMNGWFPSLQSPANKWHWIVFGFDQFLHAVVIILMVHFVNTIR